MLSMRKNYINICVIVGTIAIYFGTFTAEKVHKVNESWYKLNDFSVNLQCCITGSSNNRHIYNIGYTITDDITFE